MICIHNLETRRNWRKNNNGIYHQTHAVQRISTKTFIVVHKIQMREKKIHAHECQRTIVLRVEISVAGAFFFSIGQM